LESYSVFTVIAAVTILSPGPGVIFTLSNGIRFGFSGAIGGIFGISFGTFIVAVISATSVGVVLAASSVAFTLMKYVGAIYLLYLGIKLWRSSPITVEMKGDLKRSVKLQFLEGLVLQITNPKAVFFFMSIFPQFVDFTTNYQATFALLVATYSVLVLFIHMAYAYLAKSARGWLSTPKGGRIVNRIGGSTFMCFGIGLASANK